MKKETIIATSILIISIAGYQLHPYLWESAFYHFMASCFFLCALLCLLLARKIAGTYILKRVLYVFIWLAFNNLLDEIFFDPKSFGVNEVIIALLIISHQTYLYIKWRHQTNNQQVY